MFAQNREKFISCLQNVRNSSTPQPTPLLSERTHHKFRKIGYFLHQKVWTSASEDPLFEKCPHWTNPPFTEFERFLWTGL